MKILMVGGSGFLGAWVARFLHINQCLARIFDPNKPDSEWHRLSGIRADTTDWMTGDVSKKSELDDAIKSLRDIFDRLSDRRPAINAFDHAVGPIDNDIDAGDVPGTGFEQ